MLSTLGHNEDNPNSIECSLDNNLTQILDSNQENPKQLIDEFECTLNGLALSSLPPAVSERILSLLARCALKSPLLAKWSYFVFPNVLRCIGRLEPPEAAPSEAVCATYLSFLRTVMQNNRYREDKAAQNGSVHIAVYVFDALLRQIATGNKRDGKELLLSDLAELCREFMGNLHCEGVSVQTRIQVLVDLINSWIPQSISVSFVESTLPIVRMAILNSLDASELHKRAMLTLLLELWLRDTCRYRTFFLLINFIECDIYARQCFTDLFSVELAVKLYQIAVLHNWKHEELLFCIVENLEALRASEEPVLEMLYRDVRGDILDFCDISKKSKGPRPRRRC